MSGRILVGVDGSKGSQRALKWALEEAAIRGSVVEAVTVWQSPYDFGEMLYVPLDEAELTANATAQLTETIGAAAAEHPSVEIEPVVLEGDPAARLCEEATRADLLVVGSRGHGTLAGLLLGSVSSKCAHHSPIPLVIVPTDRDTAH